MNLPEIANLLKRDDAKIILLFAFNAVGKTQLSVAYKDATKQEDGTHVGVYYNAYSEDLFVWNNDDVNDGADIRLEVRPSSLSQFHASMTEDDIRAKLKAYKPKYDFRFKMHDDAERGIEFIKFFIPNPALEVEPPRIKISRGEERIFVWCFFLALFEVEDLADKQSGHFFIDDPVSSLDDHNIFITASTLFDLIEDYHDKRKIVIATHHIGLFSIMADWLTKGEKADKYRKLTKLSILSNSKGELSIETCRNDVFLYHLRVLQLLDQAHASNEVKSFHFALLRQALENISSFLGVGQFRYVLEQIGITDAQEVAAIINTLSHKKVYYFEGVELNSDNKAMFDKVFTGIKSKYNFVLHA